MDMVCGPEIILHQYSHDSCYGHLFVPLVTCIPTTRDVIVQEPLALCDAHIRFK